MHWRRAQTGQRTAFWAMTLCANGGAEMGVSETRLDLSRIRGVPPQSRSGARIGSRCHPGPRPTRRVRQLDRHCQAQHHGYRQRQPTFPPVAQPGLVELGSGCHQPARGRREGSIQRCLRSGPSLPVLSAGNALSARRKDTLNQDEKGMQYEYKERHYISHQRHLDTARSVD
jgi:hypothetical protein